MKPKEGQQIDLSRKVMDMSLQPEVNQKGWKPQGKSQTMPYGQGLPSVSVSLKELAHSKAEEEYRHLPKNDPIIEKRAKVLLEMMETKNG